MFKEKYIIDYERILGRGATAYVYIGIRKSDGELFALKCSHQDLKKEINICQNLDHKNIVKFYESYKLDKYPNVLVMEYCNKGSLYDFIEIHKGLCDNMFLKTLECLSDGMQYLRGKDLIHRDIKPGNMMVHMDSLGCFHVKLGDMGAAKKVADDQMFQSLVGTEEYLHPDMYIRYIEGLQKEHSVNMDLWSIGVTLFHAAATELPFLPFMYSRSNEKSKDVMKHMYNNMPKGVVRGRQKSIGKDDIEWHNDLPKKCRMSPMLKKFAANLIAQLFGRKISYDEFFKEADKILKKKRVLVFTPNNGLLQFFYLDLLTYNNIMTEACRIQELKSDEVVLLTPCLLLESSDNSQFEVVDNTPTTGHLHYELTENTVFVVPTTAEANKNLKAGTSLIDKTDIGNFNIPFESKKSSKDMLKYSSDLMKIIYKIDREANFIECQAACYKAVIKSFLENITISTVKQMHETMPWKTKLIRAEISKAENISHALDFVLLKHPSIINATDFKKYKEEINVLKSRIEEGETCSFQYHLKIVVKNEMSRFYNQEIAKLNHLDNGRIDNIVHMAEEILGQIKIFLNNSDNIDDYKSNIWIRHIQLFKYYEQAKNHVTQQHSRVQQLHTIYSNWLKQAISVMSRVYSLQEFFKRQEERRMSLYSFSYLMQRQYDAIVSTAIDSTSLSILMDKFADGN